MTDRLRILVSGRVAGAAHQGGAAWAVLQYLLGLRRLGHQVWFVEPLRGLENAAYWRTVLSGFQLLDHSVLFDPQTRDTEGMDWNQLLQTADRSDLLVNLSGVLRCEQLLSRIPVRLYLDIDPAFTQLWQDVEGIDMGFSEHNRFATIGLALGSAACSVPLCGRDWIQTLQPLVLEYWPQSEELPRYGWTTIANWRSYGSVEHKGSFYGQRAHSWRDFMNLPLLLAAQRPQERLQPALAIHPEEGRDLERFAENGWKLLDPARVAGDPASYQRFIQLSRAELGIAKSGYVLSGCGWFSDRSICYLASGRPVVAQETGFSDFLPCGRGLFSFRTSEDVLVAVDEIALDYSGHCDAARRLAMEHFDSDQVLGRLLQQLGFSS